MVDVVRHIQGEQPVVCTVPKQVAQRHGSMREAVNKQGLQKPFTIVTGIAYSCNTVIKYYIIVLKMFRF